MIVLSLLAAAITLALAPFFAYLLLLTVAALTRRPGRRPGPASRRDARFLFVIPAHDEEAGIAATVASCAAVDYDPTLVAIAVIADNCTDATARVARAAGAFVVERHDPDRKSKGHALEYFFEAIPRGRPDSSGYDAAVIIDADTVVDRGLLAAFAEALAGGADWVQGYYTVRNPEASWRTRLMTYAFSLYNGVWPLGQDGLGLSVGLKGNGMAFSAAGLRRLPWRAYGLVEDAEFGQMLRIAGERVRFAPEARVYGEMVSRGAAAASQRRRWEAGRRSLRGKFLGPLMRSRAIGPGRKVLYALDLVCPPLATLAAALLVAAGALVAAALGGAGGAALAATAASQAIMALTLALYALSPVATMGLPARYLAGLARLPQYMAWKLLTGMGRSPQSWVRTRREGGDGPGDRPQIDPGGTKSPS